MLLTVRDKCPYTGKYGLEKLHIWTLFAQRKTNFMQISKSINVYKIDLNSSSEN